MFIYFCLLIIAFLLRDVHLMEEDLLGNELSELNVDGTSVLRCIDLEDNIAVP